MLSVYAPYVSTGINANPRSCVGDSLYEWVVNTTANTWSRVRKDTYAITDTVALPNTNCINSVTGIYQGNNYIFTSSGSSGGKIHRITSAGNNPVNTLLNITISRTDSGGTGNASGTAITYSNGYLWLVPNNGSGITQSNTPIIRVNIFNNLSKSVYSYNTLTSSCDSELTVYTGITAAYNATYIYTFGNFVYTLTTGGSPAVTVISKMSTLIPGTSGIIASPSFKSFSYTAMYVSQLSSDNVTYYWFSENSSSSGMIYRMPLTYNTNINESTPVTAVISFSSTLKSVSAIKYGAGYLWIAGKTINGNSPSLVQVDTTTNTILNTIPLFTAPFASNISSIDIYNEYLWMTDTANSAVLKMKIYIPCFREGTKILCFTSQMKEEYVPVQNIRKGDLVKTSLNGFVPVSMIGKSVISNPGGNERIKNRLYKCAKSKYPELFEDLYITGCHSILVNNLSETQREKTMESLGDIFITDRKYRLMAYLDERSESYTEMGKYTIWHFALENDDYFMNYGVYANGLLVESTSKRYMKELSGMKLID
jgi:hypothetical protein